MGADRQTREALLGPSGALSASAAARNLAEIGAVVLGVNDQPAADEVAARRPNGRCERARADLSFVGGRPRRSAKPRGPLWRAGRCAGRGGQNDGERRYRAPAPHPAGARPRAFDASEGTPLDPLLNTTYDLTYAKVVPPLK